MKEHQREITKHISNHSVISQHRISYEHDFNLMDILEPEILHKETNTKKREIAEAFFIKKHEHTINLQNDTANFTPIYDKIVRST